MPCLSRERGTSTTFPFAARLQPPSRLTAAVLCRGPGVSVPRGDDDVARRRGRGRGPTVDIFLPLARAASAFFFLSSAGAAAEAEWVRWRNAPSHDSREDVLARSAARSTPPTPSASTRPYAPPPARVNQPLRAGAASLSYVLNVSTSTKKLCGTRAIPIIFLDLQVLGFLAETRAPSDA